MFRPQGVWGGTATAVMSLALAASCGWEMVAQAWPVYDALLPSAFGTQLAFALPFLWSAREAGTEWSRARRKHALGLTSRESVHRFGLWCLACTGLVGICLLAIAAPVAKAGGETMLSSTFVGLRAALYYAVTAAIWLGMFSPAFFARQAETLPA